MTASVTRLLTYKLAKTRERQHNEYVIRKYKQEITDWCGHDLACELVSEKTGIEQHIVRNIIQDAGVIF